MTTCKTTIMSAWPADQTFGYLAALNNSADWDPGVLSARQIGTGPVAEGTAFRLEVPFAGRRLGLTYRVTDISWPDREVTFEAATRLLRVRDHITVRPGQPQDPGSVVRYSATLSLRGPFRLVAFIMKRGFRLVCDRAADGLADVLAASPHPGGHGERLAPDAGSAR